MSTAEVETRTVPASWTRRHLLGLEDLSTAELTTILDTAASFKEAGYDARAAPIYAQALVGMVTFVGKWWTDVRKPGVEEVARHISALAWMGLRHLPKRPTLKVPA